MSPLSSFWGGARLRSMCRQGGLSRPLRCLAVGPPFGPERNRTLDALDEAPVHCDQSLVAPTALLLIAGLPRRFLAAHVRHAATVSLAVARHHDTRRGRGSTRRAYAHERRFGESGARGEKDERARVSLRWCHLLWKSVCFSMCAGSAHWCHFSPKSVEISTNSTIRSESRRGRCRPPSCAVTDDSTHDTVSYHPPEFAADPAARHGRTTPSGHAAGIR